MQCGFGVACVWQSKAKNSVPAAASSLREVLHLKNKIFLGKKLGRYAAINEQTKRCVMPRLLRSRLQSKSMGRAWCGHARPTTTLGAGKIWCGQILPFCSKKEQKNKNYCVTSVEKVISTYLFEFFQLFLHLPPNPISIVDSYNYQIQIV